MPRTVIVFDRDGDTGPLMAHLRTAGHQGEPYLAVIDRVLQQHGYHHDPGTGFYRQPQERSLYEQLHQTALAISVLTELGHDVHAEQQLLATHVLLTSPSARVQRLRSAPTPAAAAHILNGELADEGGLFPQLIRFFEEAAEITSRHDGSAAREATARLASAAVVLRSMHTALAGIGTQVSGLRHPRQPHPPGPAPGADRPRSR
ncbi:hypothetical protein [Streptomyces carpaticus]|uniref:hypothetical protein n=1 Tax=Streptomyces carpaticus TaxID=285558 RepID=UPI0031F9012E